MVLADRKHILVAGCENDELFLIRMVLSLAKATANEHVADNREWLLMSVSKNHRYHIDPRLVAQAGNKRLSNLRLMSRTVNACDHQLKNPIVETCRREDHQA
jgi:hypothetical protein